MRKIVGIVTKHVSPKEYSSTGRASSFVIDETKQALIDVGLLPIGILPPKWSICHKSIPDHVDLTASEFNVLSEELNLCDGLVFQGGGRIDDYEYTLMNYAFKNNIPILAICMGQTVMAKIFNAEIVDADPKTHKKSCDYAHACSVVSGTLFHDIVRSKQIQVNSRHVHSVKSLDSLTISAFDCDGNAEVIESEDKNFFLGVRFHPESLYKTDKKMRAIFESFAHSIGR